MKTKLLLFLSLFFVIATQAQDGGRHYLRGKVLYKGGNVPGQNVINTTTEKATVTDDNGEFGIDVKAGDELVFIALNYNVEAILITDEIIKNNRLVVEVNEKVTALSEVVVSPEDQERFIQLTNEKFKEYSYEVDETSDVKNVAMSQIDNGGLQDGLNFKNIFKAIFNANKEKPQEERVPLKMSDVLRQVYDTDFFVKDLGLPKEQIEAFLFYCDAQMPAQSLLKKSNEFQLIDFLVNQSKAFKAQLAKE